MDNRITSIAPKPLTGAFASVWTLLLLAGAACSGDATIDDDHNGDDPSQDPALSLTDEVYVQSNRNHLCVRGEAVPGGVVTQGPCDRGATVFEIYAFDDGRIVLQAKETGFCLQMKDGNVDDAGLAAMGPCSTTEASQQYRFLDAAATVKRLENVKSHKCLDIPHWLDDTGAPLGQWTCLPNENQGFLLLRELPIHGAKKWHPGHYVRANTLGFLTNTADRANAYDRIRNESVIRGAVLSVPWGSIERGEGVYDFSSIDFDRDYLKAMNKKLIIEVWWQKYGGSVPDTRFFPQYIVDANGVDSLPNGEHHIKINEDRWAERYYQLQRVLADRYDNDPAVEQVVVTETASTSAYVFLTLFPRVNQLWPSTPVVLYPNWVDTAELARDLLKVLASVGGGVGAPDLISPTVQHYEDHGSRALRGKGVQPIYGPDSPPGDFGTVDYRGRIPVAYQFQFIGEVPASRLIDYGVNELKATHLIWSIVGDWDGDTLPAVKQHATLVEACPTSFAGCNTR